MSIDDLSLVASYRTILHDSLSQTQRTGAVKELKALRHNDNATDDPSAHTTTIEAVVRETFVELVATSDIHEQDFERVWSLIDTVNDLSDNELCEPGLGFYLVEELLDAQTIDGCGRVFDYLESRREPMVKKNFKSKSLVILRCCNELLRRLSRAEDTVFCGRVFIYLFQVFPLGDKSSVNLRGEFHVENVTVFDEAPQESEDAIHPMELDSEVAPLTTSGQATPMSTQAEAEQKTARSTPSVRGKLEGKAESAPDLDALYPMFWSLQGLFSRPTRLFEPACMQDFKDRLGATLSCFKFVSTHSTPASEPSDVRRSLKRKRRDDNTSAFNPKYLTNRDLFDLEIHDIAFRRHVLVQALILIDFLLSLNPASKVRTASSTNKSVLYAYTLSDDDTKWAQHTRSSIATYLQQSGMGSEGSLYYRMVDTVLSRDKNWVRWKAENCPPISMPPITAQATVDAQATLQKLTRVMPLVSPPGASDLAFLQQTEPLEALKHPSQRYRMPSVQDYYKSIQGDDLDLEMAMDDQEKNEIEERKAGKLWRALRAAQGRRFVLCEQIKDGANLDALVATSGQPSNGDVEGDHAATSGQHEDAITPADDDAEAAVGDDGNDGEDAGDGVEDSSDHVANGGSNVVDEDDEAKGADAHAITNTLHDDATEGVADALMDEAPTPGTSEAAHAASAPVVELGVDPAALVDADGPPADLSEGPAESGMEVIAAAPATASQADAADKAAPVAATAARVDRGD